MYVVYLGVESIRKLLVFKAFFLPLAALALLWWAISAGHGLGPILAQPSKFTTSAAFWAFFFPSLTGMVGFWATLSLNIPDFTRYAVSQRAQQLGQALALPASMTLFSFVGVVVTSATFIIYGKTIWDPVVLAGRFDSKLLVSFAMIAVALSTLATNIAANIVSPANDFANFSPERISFKTGGYITGVLGVLIFPWKLIADPSGYIFTWLVGYSGLLGPIGGIMIVDYYLIRRQQLDLPDLYQYPAATPIGAASTRRPSSPCISACCPTCRASSRPLARWKRARCGPRWWRCTIMRGSWVSWFRGAFTCC